MNKLTVPKTQTHPTIRQAQAKQKEIRERDRKALEYMNSVTPKLRKFYNNKNDKSMV